MNEQTTIPCSCGSIMIPIEVRQIIKEEPFEQILHISWKCRDCGKVVER